MCHMWPSLRKPMYAPEFVFFHHVLGFLSDLRVVYRVFKGSLHMHDSWDVVLSLLGALCLSGKSFSSLWTFFHCLPTHLLLWLDLVGQGIEQPLFVGLDWYLELIDLFLCQSYCSVSSFQSYWLVYLCEPSFQERLYPTLGKPSVCLWGVE